MVGDSQRTLKRKSCIRRRTNLGSDGDAALALEGNGIHGALVGDVGAALAEKAVHESGLAVVDMGDNRHVAEAAGVKRSVERSDGGGGSGSEGT